MLNFDEHGRVVCDCVRAEGLNGVVVVQVIRLVRQRDRHLVFRFICPSCHCAVDYDVDDRTMIHYKYEDSVLREVDS
ncbi:Uncharacterised protein [uncultured archaeon]|nr:Uncharacterised protein [uncultured archaeon]